MIKAVIFDLDGVTVDSRAVWFESFKRAAKKYGFKYSENLDYLTRGVGVIKAAKNLSSHYGTSDKNEEFLKTVREYFKNLFFQNVQLMPGVLKLLERLAKDYKLALASSSPRFILEDNFAKFPQLNKYFKISVAGDEVQRTKPSPDIFILAARRLAVDSKNCLVIEDSPAGVAAAKAAGMFCFGLLDPGPDKQDLSKADQRVENLAQIDEALILALRRP